MSTWGWKTGRIGLWLAAIGSLATSAAAQSLQYLCDPAEPTFNRQECKRQLDRKVGQVERLIRQQQPKQAATYGWTVLTTTDPLDASIKTTVAYNAASKVPVVNGQPINARLYAYCGVDNRSLFGSRQYFFIGIEFSQQMLTPQMWGRWRIDSNPVEILNIPMGGAPAGYRGSIEVLRDGMNRSSDMMLPLLRGQKLLLEVHHPQAGSLVFEFQLTSTANAFAATGCRA